MYWNFGQTVQTLRVAESKVRVLRNINPKSEIVSHEQLQCVSMKEKKKALLVNWTVQFLTMKIFALYSSNYLQNTVSFQ